MIKVLTYDAVVVGSGCAGLNAVDWLHSGGKKNIALVTEGMNKGTSRNTGSDKQTYYKLSLSSDQSDSVGEMAQTLYQAGSVSGDIALTEAACSVQCFMKLVNLGVDFPTNKYGEYVGYKTDHDPRKRGTSAGPLTSRDMTEKLEQSVIQRGITIHDKTTIIKIVVSDNQVLGLIALEREGCEVSLCYIRSPYIIFCTGGPAICYADSVYPTSQTGMSGVLFDAGVHGANLQDWQYGLASIKFRWNVSGSYQQVIPRYISIDKDGVEREFLFDQGVDPEDVIHRVFLKGYQWPFDIAKVGGSSDIDLWVYHETAILGRRVFLDYRSNPRYVTEDLSSLSYEAYKYLEKSGALLGTPIERLKAMNPLAIQLYKKHNIDLYKEPLEIRVCAQHHNGGALVDHNWETNIQGLYVAGEAAGTFGAYRPGGSALNSTQVGSMRAAQHICFRKRTLCIPEEISLHETKAIELYEKLVDTIGTNSKSVNSIYKKFQTSMTTFAGHIRTKEGLRRLLHEIEELIPHFFSTVTAPSLELVKVFKAYDMLIAEKAILSAMLLSAEICGSRGSALVAGSSVKNTPTHIRIITKKNGSSFESFSETIPPLPEEVNWFESVWAYHREKKQ